MCPLINQNVFGKCYVSILVSPTIAGKVLPVFNNNISQEIVFSGIQASCRKEKTS
jgi:hypothetical protein